MDSRPDRCESHMKLDHAIRLAARATVSSDPLTPDEKIAVGALVELARRVTRAKVAVRDLAKALYGDELNQTDLFGEKES